MTEPQLAIDLALRFNGEIINGDAMQMYAGLPIITNKVTPEKQKGVPHHLLSCVALHQEPWRVGKFKVEASRIIKEIRSRGKLPIVVGGTHYYTQSLLVEDGLVTAGPAEEGNGVGEFATEELRERYPILRESPERILEKLREVDPKMAERWHPKDRRKIQRSLEIWLITGRRASQVYEDQRTRRGIRSIGAEDCVSDSGDGEAVSARCSPLLFWVHAEDQALKNRLDSRVDKMVQSGLIDEAISIDAFISEQESLGVSMDQSSGIWASIGYKELRSYLATLKTGSASKEELTTLRNNAIGLIKGATRRYAKRQARWIRLQLIKALSSQGQLDRLYLLDGSDLSLWSRDVSAPAIQITEQFLAGTDTPPAHTLSELAKQYLDPESLTKSSGGENSYFREECAMCSTVAVTEDAWLRHLKSRRHRALKRKEQKRVAKERLPRSKSPSESDGKET